MMSRIRILSIFQPVIPVDVHMVTLRVGEGKVKKATVEDVFSIPLLALLKGMKSMRWPALTG